MKYDSYDTTDIYGKDHYKLTIYQHDFTAREIIASNCDEYTLTQSGYNLIVDCADEDCRDNIASAIRKYNRDYVIMENMDGSELDLFIGNIWASVAGLMMMQAYVNRENEALEMFVYKYDKVQS